MKMKKLTSLLLAGVMALSMGAAAFASEPETQADTEVPQVTLVDGKLQVTKKLKFSKQVTSLPAMTFSFAAEAKSKPTTVATAPTVTVADVEFEAISDVAAAVSAGTVKEEDGYYYITGTADVDATFTKPGEYRYEITETASTNNDATFKNALTGYEQSITYNSKDYTVRMYVEYDNGEYVLKNVTVGVTEGKMDNFVVENTYLKSKNGTTDPDVDPSDPKSGNAPALKITTETTGTYADPDASFTYRVILTKDSLVPDTETSVTYKVYKYNAQDQLVATEGTVAYGATLEQVLKSGEYIEFETLPVGTQYTAEEVGDGNDYYWPQVTVVENGTEIATDVKASTHGASLYANATGLVGGGKVTIGEGTNTAAFENVWYDSEGSGVITGVVMDNLPFILLAAVGCGALVILAVSKKRFTEGR